MKQELRTERLTAFYGNHCAIRDVTMTFRAKAITALIGPSGCGKSTLLRCLNRMHEVIANTSVKGQVLLDGSNVYDSGVDTTSLRRRVGMVFQRPNPFPTMSISDNVLAGVRLAGGVSDRGVLAEIAERSLRRAALWDEVKDILNRPGTSLSGGQQQRLCIARALAVEPEVLLMDEPASALDPISTMKIEDLMRELVRNYTIVIVTHNMQQAARVSDQTVFFSLNEKRHGMLVEASPTRDLFTNPRDQRTEDYL